MTTYNTGNPIGSTDARDLYDNAQNLDTAVNSTAGTFTDRLGVVRPTLKSATDPSGLVQTAVNAKVAAEAARDAAVVNSTMYPDEATGHAAVADGAYFKVIGSGDIACKEYRRTDAANWALVATYPSKGYIDREAVNVRSAYAQKSNGKNLLNPNDPNIKKGYYLNAGGGYLVLSGYAVTGFIPIAVGQSLRCSLGSGGAYNVLYDENLSPISWSQFNTTLVGTAASKYARFSVPREDLSTVQVEIGSTSTVFEAYTEVNQAIQFTKSVQTQVNEAELKIKTKLDKTIGKNLFNPNDSDILVGYYIGSNGDIISTQYNLNVSGKIPIKAGQSLKANFSVGNTYAALYDSNGVYIAGSAVNSNLIAYAAGAAYARFSYYTPGTNLQVEVGTVSTTFEAFTENAPLVALARRLPDRESVVVLPSKLFFVKNFESSLYHENIVFKNLNHPAQVNLSIGLGYSRQVKIQQTSAGTGLSFNAQVAENFKLGSSKSFSYDVKDPAANAGKTVNILYIGDSFTDIGTWNKRVTALLRTDGVTVNEIGTTGSATFKAEGLSGGNIANTFLNASAGVARIVQVSGVSVVPETGYPGTVYKDANNAQWTVRGGKVDGNGAGKLVVTKYGAVNGDFTNFPSTGTLTKLSGVGDATINYSAPVAAYFNPFINHSTGLLDIGHYISFWGFNAPNVVVFQFTWNDTGLWSSDPSINNVVANFKAAADHVHAAYPSAKIVFSIEPPGSFNANRDFNGKKYTVLRLVELLCAAFEVPEYSWVTIAPSYAFVDLVYGYSSSTVAPSSKYPAVTEQSGGDGVHPATAGMEQIGECVYQVVSHIV